ncbi:RNA polymerase sigma factor [Planctomycetota bacterium]
MHELTDKELTFALLRKEASAFEELYRRFSGGLYRYAGTLLGNKTESEDIVQQTFVNVYRAILRGQRPKVLSAYLYSAARHETLKRIRSESREVEARQAWGELQKEQKSAGMEFKDTATRHIFEALRGLPLEQAEVILLHVFAGLTFQEVAAVQKAPLKTCYKRYTLASGKLKEQLHDIF